MVIRTVVKSRQTLPDSVEQALPYSLTQRICELSDKGNIEEIRVRRDRCASVILSGENVMLDYKTSQSEINEIMTRMCKGSLYAYSDTINQGYLSLPEGVRVGVVGRATCESGRVVGVYDVSSLCIRIPHTVKRVGQEICDLLLSLGSGKGVLIYSPPGVGKTTLLRGCVNILSSGSSPLRTLVVDTRGELEFSSDGENLCLDVLSGYPRRAGIEIATRCMNAQLIVCDEIGDYEEAMALVSSHNCGVPLIASAHAGDLSELLSRTGIRLLHEAGIFGAYVGIRRAPKMDFTYDIVLRHAASDSISF